MAKQFEFADFVKEFWVDFTVFDILPGQYNNSGKWVKGEETPRASGGIVLPLTNDDLKYEANGTYSANDRKIYVTEKLKHGQKIEYDGKTFTIDGSKPYEAYADVYIYFAKGVSK